MAQNSKIKTLTKNTLWVYFGKIGTQLFTFVTAVLVIRQLDESMYGTYNLLLKVIIFFNVFSVSPIKSVFSRYIPVLIQNKDNYRFRKLISIGSVLIVGSTLLLAFSLYYFRGWISGLNSFENLNQNILALLAYLFMMVLREALTSILTSSLLHKYTSLFLVFSSLTRAILLVILLKGLTVSKILYVDAIASLVYVVPGLFVFFRFFRTMRLNSRDVKENPIKRKAVTRFGLYSSANELGAGIVGKTSDYFIIALMSNVYNVGIYSFANKIYELIFKLLPYKEFLTVVRPLFFQKFTQQHDREEFYNIYNFMVKAVIPIYFIPVLYFIVFGKSLIIYVFDPKYISAYIVCVLVLLSNIYYAIFFPVNMVLMLRERMDIALLSKIIVVFSIGAGILAMKHFGVVGVAAATLVGDFLKNLFILILLNRDTKIVYRYQQYRNYILMFLAINIPFFLVANAYQTIPVLIVGSLLYFVVTLFVLVKFHPFTKYDLGLFEKMGQASKPTRILRKVITIIYNLPVFKAA